MRFLREPERESIADSSLHRSLDLSFNLIRSVTPFVDESAESPYAFPELTHLYLIQNKLGKIEGVRHRHKLVYLEFGGNRIRVCHYLLSPGHSVDFFGSELPRLSNIFPYLQICVHSSWGRTKSLKSKAWRD